MMAPEYYVFTGREGERIPRHINHVLIDKSREFVPSGAFYQHPNPLIRAYSGERHSNIPNIEELICHDGVEKIEREAFYNCPSLRWIIMPGVKVVETDAFTFCSALTYIECGKLERIGAAAFRGCTSLSSVDLPSIKIVEAGAFSNCTNLINAKFGKDLESIRRWAFEGCTSLERITLPLKDGIIADNDNIFGGCKKLNHIDLVEGVHETAAALLLEEWKNDMNEEIDSISQILASAPAGNWRDDSGGKARAMRTGIESVLRKIIHYKVEHHSMMDEAAATIQLVLPQDIVRNNVLSFLELPPHWFELEDHGGRRRLQRRRSVE